MEGGSAVHAQSLRFVPQGDEQQANLRVHLDVSEAFEHAVAVIVGKHQKVGCGHPHEADRAALERAIGAPLSIRSGQEKEALALDKGLVVFLETVAPKSLDQTVS